VDDMQTLGNRIEQASKSYETAFNKLSSGRGNVLSRAQKLHRLGVQSTKNLPENLIQAALESDEESRP